MSKLLSVSIAVLIALSIMSCSGKATPTSTDVSGINQTSNSQIADGIDRTAKLYPGLFGAWKVYIDVESLSAEIIPARNAGGIGAIFDADLSQFLNVSPCTNCLRIPRISLDSYEDLNVRIQVKHPFGDITKRPDLHGFDVRAIFIADQSNPVTFDQIMVMKPDGTEEPAQINYIHDGLLNADGYTSHFDSLVMDDRYFPGGTDVPGNLNPFLRFFESYTTGAFDPQNPTGHNVMKVGADWYDRVAVFDKETLSHGLSFYIVADVAYGQSATLANRTNPQYYLPSFNRTEAWRAEYWLENNTLRGGDNTSSSDVVVQVFDWQQGFAEDPTYPNPANLSGLKQSSNVAQIELYVPDLMNDPVIVMVPESGTGAPDNPLQYRFTVTNDKSYYGDAMGLIAVRDQLYGVASPGGRIPIPASPAGFPYETEDIQDYSLYYAIYIPFASNYWPYFWQHKAINAELFVPWEEFFSSNYPPPILHPIYYSDLGHKKYQYKWDLDYDGVTFNEDASGLPSPDLNLTEAGKHNIGLRVRTNSKPTHETIFTIPVYKEGISYSRSPFDSGSTTATSSPQGQNAIAMTSDIFYLVSTREIAGNREIWLSILDRAGNAASTQVTDVSWPAYDPTITVIDSGPNAGLYIAFVEQSPGESYVYFTKGQLNGTGFTTPERITWNSDNIENRPVITYIFDKLFIYYLHTTTINVTYVADVRSDNLGDDWTELGSIIGIGSNYQTDHSISAFTEWGEDLWIVWSDALNDAQTGLDLYTAHTDDGGYFDDIRCISSIPGHVDEYASSTACGSEEIAIAYLAQPQFDPKSYAHMKIIHNTYYSDADWPLKTWDLNSDQTFTRPCIAYSGVGIYLMSYGVYDTSVHTLDAHLDKLVGTVWHGRFDQYEILMKNAGVVDAANNGGQIFPCLAPYKEIYTSTEGLLVYRQFNDGFVTSVNNPGMVLGDLDSVYFVADGAKD
jgi:hypothetical protein